MSGWFVPAAVAAFLWSCVNVVDDHLLRTVYREPSVATGMAGCAGIVPAGIVFASHGRVSLDGSIVALGVLGGFGMTLYLYLLFFAFARHEPSIVIALAGVGQIMLPVVAAIAVDERLSPAQYVGILIIAAGTSGLALLDRRSSGISARLLLLSSVGAALFVGVSVCLKQAYDGDTFQNVFPWYGVGSAVGGAGFLVAAGRTRLAPAVAVIDKRLLGLIVAIEGVNGVADYLQGWAISLGPVSAVRAVEGSQPIVVLAIGVVLSRVTGGISRERATAVWAKAVLFVALVVGVVLVA